MKPDSSSQENSIMSFDHFVDTKCPRECAICPQCESINWVLGPHPYLMDYTGDESVECWRCSNIFWTNDYYKDTYGDNLDDTTPVKGVPDPVIPRNVLETLVDLAQAQRDQLVRQLQETEDDDSLMEYIRHVEDCANYVKTLLQEGRLTEAEVPRDLPF